jgi:uncharacterized protein YbjT (DUF2867 family)
MAIILTGSTGKTAIQIAELLKQANIPFVLTSRKGPVGAARMPVARFDWRLLDISKPVPAQP